ncbi:MAG TPA: glutamine synthetase, partial [Planctomycetes bacterium]|nr:glutamine synthetase [Planctomycetota bacterium]
MSEEYILTREKLQDMVNQIPFINTVVAVFPDLYGRLLGKRFDAEYFLESTMDHGTHAC